MKSMIATIVLLLTFITPTFATHPGGTVFADVNGLVCDFCARALERVFDKQEAVESIHVDLDEKVITIHFHEGQRLDDDMITELIADSGYDVRDIRHAD